VDLLPHARHAEDDVGPHLLEVGGQLRRLRAGGDLVALQDLAVVAHHPLGDVGHREVRDHALAGEVEIVAEAAAQALGRVDDVEVRDHHALGRPGGARGVDHGGEHLGGDVGGGVAEVGRLGAEQVVAVVGQAEDVLELRELLLHLEEALDEAVVLGDGNAGVAVPGEVGHLLG
jgi:hypothetical protein